MGTHPIFESDFDCLTDQMSLLRSRVLRFSVPLTVGLSGYSQISTRMAASAHEFDVVMNNGENQSLSVYKGHPLVVVNVASQ